MVDQNTAAIAFTGICAIALIGIQKSEEFLLTFDLFAIQHQKALSATLKL